ncbi:hypothetical protein PAPPERLAPAPP_00890 [Brevundimonas phage vB_BpoS-Papperlapapp]|uniref:Uncharacterized protein n=1 Tax=Brevundimonas phage vB_BpoS-Kabachok TaxID=2948600 RepID=A0A9E7MPT2_9CAUD|nr:hypothetical protein KABACHOK_05120 [Brevundimonas phage vB_BpoS-Kabachok]USN15831.1 hypothetical protein PAPPERLAPAPP_00890 [Brevundimonas phage vB_BpoS-Papperlapapp]
MPSQTDKFRTGPGAAGAPQQLRPAGSVSFGKLPEAEDTLTATALPAHLTTVGMTNTEIKACVGLARVMEASGAGWVTETQWRSFADRDLAAHRVRGFRIPELVAKGAVEEASALFHAARNGQEAAPLPIYRINPNP